MAPGSLTEKDADRLREMVRGKRVLQLGGYCGRASVVIAGACERLMVVDDFRGYRVSCGVLMKEYLSYVGPHDATVDIKIENPLDYRHDGERYDVVYLDADLPDAEAVMPRAADVNGVVVHHDAKGRLVRQVMKPCLAVA